MAAVPKLDFEVVNLLNKLIFAAWCISEPISGINADIKFNNLPYQNKDSKRFIYYILVNWISIVFSGCRSK